MGLTCPSSFSLTLRHSSSTALILEFVEARASSSCLILTSNPSIVLLMSSHAFFTFKVCFLRDGKGGEIGRWGSDVKRERERERERGHSRDAVWVIFDLVQLDLEPPCFFLELLFFSL